MLRKRDWLVPFGLLCACLTLMVGCAALDSMAPDDTGDPVAQVASVVHGATTNPVIRDAAGTVPGGQSVLDLVGLAALSVLSVERHLTATKHKRKAKTLEGKLADIAATAKDVLSKPILPASASG
jgi:hypothetical protein